MIRKVTTNDLAECVEVIKYSFLTVADEFGFTLVELLCSEEKALSIRKATISD